MAYAFIMLTEIQRSYAENAGLRNLLSAQTEGDGWFMAAPGYPPYGNYVWHRDNAECVIALDEYAATFGRTELFDSTRKALASSFRYFESKRKGVETLAKMRNKVRNPEFYNDSFHPHARLTRTGDELREPWHNIQYDSVARSLVALAKHLSFTRDRELMEKCRPGIEVAIRYLFDAVWDGGDVGPRWLTVCANEWEELNEPYLRGPLFSSVVGLLLASSRYCQTTLQQSVDLRDVDLRGCERQAEAMLNGFFVRSGILRMIKRYDEPPVGLCATALWLLTTYDVFPVESDVFKKTVNAFIANGNLAVEMEPVHGRPLGYGGKTVCLRRYETVTSDHELPAEMKHVDTYWGGEAWVITTAQLATALVMKGEIERACATLELCLRTQDSEGRLPEQFPGTYHDRGHYDTWSGWSRTPTPPPWLSWSHAEVLRTVAAIHRAGKP